jgi:hypothetical protein
VTARERGQNRRRVRYAWSGAVVGIAVLMTAVHVLFRPLDVLWLTLLRRFGA